jgi:N6-L-threonylcarbamoyladenine synthase
MAPLFKFIKNLKKSNKSGKMFVFKTMKILGLETSCDDTCIAILEIKNQGTKIKYKTLSNIISSQIKIHKKYGGVYPFLAKREHQLNLVPILKKSLLKAKLLKKGKCFLTKKKEIMIKKILKREEVLYPQLKKFLEKWQKPKIDLLSVTIGPGLEPCLWVGVNFIKTLALCWNLKVVEVNHIKAHILSAFFKNIESGVIDLKKIKFPAIALIVSGGHSQLILMKNLKNYKIIGETKDDAAGECLDKTARIIGLSYPGGPLIEKEAKKFKSLKDRFSLENHLLKLPRPMINSKDYYFSFSGLKTAVLYKWQKIKKKTKEQRQMFAYEIENAVIDVLTKKTIKAIKNYQAKTIILGGGVSANENLRKRFKSEIKKENLKVDFFAPPKILSTDNGLMVALSGFFDKNKRKSYKDIKADANLKI